MAVTRRAFTARVNPAALRMALNFRRYSYREMERRSGVSYSLIGHLVTGQRSTCNPETAAKIADALDVETSEIFMLEALHGTESSTRMAV